MTDEAVEATPAISRWAATLRTTSSNHHSSESDGDLWPSCWAADGLMYSAWGDGYGFLPNDEWVDIGTARIHGDLDNLRGENTALADAVGQVWNSGCTRKPTGMVCVGNTIYLAVQDLSTEFDHAPAATVARSDDGGHSWSWDTEAPMFSDHVFTTIFFADYGRGGELNSSNFLYAYGLDGNWRCSPTGKAPDPIDLFLARVPQDAVQDRASWQFFAGPGPDEQPRWSSAVADRASVLHDERRDYPLAHHAASGLNASVLGQGGVTYLPAPRRYVLVSWSEWVHHYYEAPEPWGPWSRIADEDFTSFDDRTQRYGGYGTSLPSKFVSDDGMTLMLQSNRCCGGDIGYSYSLRPVQLGLYQDTVDAPTTGNLGLDPNTAIVSKSFSGSDISVLLDPDPNHWVDDRDGEQKSASWWGFTWPRAKQVDTVEFIMGPNDVDGGWFNSAPTIQYRRQGVWNDIPGQRYSTVLQPPKQPNAPTNPEPEPAPANRHVVTFAAVIADGIRLIGQPGGPATFTRLQHLQARVDQPIDNGENPAHIRKTR